MLGADARPNLELYATVYTERKAYQLWAEKLRPCLEAGIRRRAMKRNPAKVDAARLASAGRYGTGEARWVISADARSGRSVYEALGVAHSSMPHER